MELDGATVMHLTFNNVAVYFSEEEWKRLQDKELELYIEVMNDTYTSLQALGLPVPKSNFSRNVQQSEKRPVSIVSSIEKPSRAPFQTGMPVPEPSLLQHGQQKRLVCNAGTPSHAPPQTGLPVQEPSLLQHGQQQEKRLVCNAGTPSHAPPQTGLPVPEPSLSQHGQQYEMSAVSNPTKPSPSPLQTECDPSNPKLQQELELHNLASFSRKMLHNSNLKPKCQACRGMLTCYCNALKKNKNKPFSCIDCGKSYSSEVHLILHKKTHLQEGLYKCRLCEKSFGNHKLLKRHLRTHRCGVYTCEQCRMVFSSSYELTAHKKDHRQARKHPCLICGQIFFAYAELYGHLKGHQKPYKCATCGLIFPNRPNFVAHLREHAGEQIYKCKICEKTYTHLAFFTKHMDVHSAAGSADVKEEGACMQADYWQPSLPAENSTGPYEDGIKHIFSGLPPNRVLKALLPPMDSLSTTVVPVKKEGNLGFWDEHPPECNPFEAGKPVRCKRCKKHFRHHASFLRHRKSHHVRFVCSWCGQTFRKLIKLYIHRAEHQNYRPFNCKYCIQAFSSRSLLLLHQNTHRLTSLLWSRYPCAYCRKVFRSPADRDSHHKTHVYQPGSSIFPPIPNNITIAPFTDQSTDHKKPLEESPASRAYIKRLCYRPCD